ncbi:MAG: N-acetylmuramoyl-L-alanine amidase [Mucilaginibacter sp.]
MIKRLKVIGFYGLLATMLVLAGCSNKTKGVLVAAPTLPPNANAGTNIIPVLPAPLTTQQFYTVKKDSLLNIVEQEQPLTLLDSLGVPIPSAWAGTVNFGIRRPNYVIIHFTGQDSIQQTLKTFSLLSTEVSAHYVVGKDGKIYHLVNDYMRSNHAGVGKWGSVTDMNSCSLGIEIDNNGTEPFTDAEVKSLLALLDYLKRTYNIPTANFIGHEDFAPKRKPDPGPLFPWKLLAQKGFGYWQDDVLEPAPANFDPAIALRLIGYDTSDLNAAIIAFKRHFVQTDISPILSPQDLNVLYNVYKKY